MNNIQEQAEELWDKYSEHIEDDSTSFSRVAGTSLINREQFLKAIAALTEKESPKVEEGHVEGIYSAIYNNISAYGGELSGLNEAVEECTSIALSHSKEQVNNLIGEIQQLRETNEKAFDAITVFQKLQPYEVAVSLKEHAIGFAEWRDENNWLAYTTGWLVKYDTKQISSYADVYFLYKNRK